MARYLADAGFDTWILEVRGAGLSKREGEPTAVELSGAGGALSGVVEDTVVGAAIKGAAKATPHMEKHIEERHLKKGDGPVTASPKTSSNGSSASSFEYQKPPFTSQNIESKADDAAESAIKGRAGKEPKKEQSWLTSAVSGMTERYKRLVHVNQSYLRDKYINKVKTLFFHLCSGL